MVTETLESKIGRPALGTGMEMLHDGSKSTPPTRMNYPCLLAGKAEKLVDSPLFVGPEVTGVQEKGQALL